MATHEWLLQPTTHHTMQRHSCSAPLGLARHEKQAFPGLPAVARGYARTAPLGA